MTETAYASAYARQRVRSVRVLPDTRDTLTADFRAILADGETLTSADWQASCPEVCGLVSATIVVSASSVIVYAIRSGESSIRCQVTTSTGRILNQHFVVEVGCSDFDATGAAGLASLTVSVPGG